MGFSGPGWGDVQAGPVREEMVGIGRAYDMTALDGWLSRVSVAKWTLIHELLVHT